MKFILHVIRVLMVSAAAGILLFPLAVLIFYSITDAGTVEQVISRIHSKTAGQKFFPIAFDFTNYLQIATESKKFSVALLNSLFYSFVTTFGQLLFAIPAAIALSVLKVKGRSILIPIYMIVMMMPFQVTMVPNYISLYNFNLLDQPLAIIVPQIFMPFSVVIIYLFMIRIPDELHEAARVDGAGTFQLIRHITLPLCKHGIWAVGLLHFIDSWNMIEQPLVFLSSIESMPLSILIRQSIETNPSDMFVPAVLFMLPIMIMYGLYYRYVISGLQVSFVGIREKEVA